MFKILIVDDSTEKVKEITQTLRAIDEIDINKIEHVIDAMSAKNLLKENFYDLLILDIAIPPSKDKDIDLNGGLKLLDEILVRDKYNIPNQIIGLSGRDEIFEAAKEHFEGKARHLIKYSESNVGWQSAISEGVKSWIQSKNVNIDSQDAYNYDIAIICALNEELDANMNNGWNWTGKNVSHDDSIYYESEVTIEDRVIKIIAASSERMGMPASTALATKVILQFRPKYILMTGIMAGVSGRVNLGDVVIPHPVWDWGSGKWVPDPDNKEGQPHSRFLIDPFQFTVDTAVLKQIRNIQKDDSLLFELRKKFGHGAPNTDTKVHIGAAASGASVLSDKSTFKNIMDQHRKLLGIEMEAFGLHSAVESSSKPRPIPVCIKAVVDYGDQDKSDDVHAYGTYISAQIGKRLVELLFSS